MKNNIISAYNRKKSHCSTYHNDVNNKFTFIGEKATCVHKIESSAVYI